jgi:hypothetical protein
MASAADHPRRLLPHRLGLVLAVVAVGLVPWTLWLTFTLPTRHVTHHYRIAWVGFDLVLAAVFAATAIAVLRSSRSLQPLAAVAGTMLLCDAWFDVVTSQSGDEFNLAVVEAVVAELPLAALCAWVVLDTGRFHAAAARLVAPSRSREGRGTLEQ